VTTLVVVTTSEASRVISLRLGDELLARLEKKATDDAMTRNALIVFALGEWLAAREVLMAVVTGDAKPVEPKPEKAKSNNDGRPQHCGKPMLDFSNKWKCSECSYARMK
jgi:hypothetical protein